MKILNKVLESVAEHARECYPEECCGILLAHGLEEPMVTCSLRAENEEILSPSERYILGHRAHLKAVELEASGQYRIAGYYHSHPGGRARPSVLDLEQAVPGASYLITAFGGKKAWHSLWRLNGDDLVSEPLEVREKDGHQKN